MYGTGSLQKRCGSVPSFGKRTRGGKNALSEVHPLIRPKQPPPTLQRLDRRPQLRHLVPILFVQPLLRFPPLSPASEPAKAVQLLVLTARVEARFVPAESDDNSLSDGLVAVLTGEEGRRRG